MYKVILYEKYIDLELKKIQDLTDTLTLIENFTLDKNIIVSIYDGIFDIDYINKNN